jgi:hypothetical protein
MTERHRRNSIETLVLWSLITLALLVLWALVAPILADIAALMRALANQLARVFVPERSTDATISSTNADS